METKGKMRLAGRFFLLMIVLQVSGTKDSDPNISPSMSISPQVNVSHCFQCQGDTEYHCLTCSHNLCPPCMRLHVISHDVKLYRKKFNSISNNETCVTHSDQVYEMYCETCCLPICFHCIKHKQHKVQNIRDAYEQRYKDTIINIRSVSLYIAHVLQTEVKRYVTICQKNMVHLTAILKKSQILKDSMDTVPSEISVKYKCLLIDKLHKQMMKMKIYLNMIQIYENWYEQMAYRPVEFLRFIKKIRLPRIQDTPHFTQHYWLSLTQKINVEVLIELLSEVKTEGGKCQPENKLLLKPQKSITVNSVDLRDRIPCVTLDRVRFSEEDINLILTDTTIGEILYSVNSLNSRDIHTVNNECELIYIDKDRKINKLSIDMKITTTFIRNPNSHWKPLCVFCSLSMGDLLVVIWRPYTDTGEVKWYNNTGKLTQTIPRNNTPHTLYMRYDDNTHTFCIGSNKNNVSSLRKYLDSYRDRKDTSVFGLTRGQTENEGGHSTLRDESDKGTIENEPEKNNDTHTRINGSLDDSLALPSLSFSTEIVNRRQRGYEYHWSNVRCFSSDDSGSIFRNITCISNGGDEPRYEDEDMSENLHLFGF